ncbi:ribonuclease H-like domain-containing protein [Tanacetum coccineum]
MGKKLMISSKLVMKDPPGAIIVPISPLEKDKNQVCLLCEVILKQIPAFNFFCASLESITAIEKLGKWEKVWEDIPTLYLGFVWAGKMEFGENKMDGKSMLNNMGRVTGQREVRPVWNNAQRVNHQNKLTHPHPKRNFVPTAVLTKSGNVPVNTAKQSSSRAAVSNSTARYVNTAASRPTVNGAKPSSNVFHKSHSSVKRTIYQRTTPKNSDFKEKVNTAKVNNVTTAGTKAVVSVVQGHEENVVKSSACWIWRPIGKVIDHISKDSGSYMPKRFDYGNPQYALQDQEIFNSGCSRHMSGNKSYPTDYQDIDGGFVAFAGSPKGGKITGKGKIKTGKLDFEDVYFVKELKFNLFSVSQMCDKKNSVLFTETECLVLSPDFKLLDESQVLLKVPRQNNMYNFNLKNVVPSGGLTCLFAKATIDESNLWHRRLGHVNFKTMNKLVRGNLVRVLITKPHNKIPYELLIGRSPNLDFMRPFWCPVTILNTLDHLGKFEGKADEGFLVGYSINSKAFRVFNTRTKKVKENLHIKFLENKPNVAGSGPEWLFDIDSLIKSMNYEPVIAGNQTNDDADIETNVNAVQTGQEKASNHEYILLPFLTSDSQGPKSSNDEFVDDAGKKNDVQYLAKDGDKNGHEKDVRDQEEALRKQFDQETKRLVGQGEAIITNNTNRLNTVSPSVSAAGQSFDNNDLLTNPLMHDLEDSNGIFRGAYDDEDVGAEADLNNLEITMNVSPIPITRIHKDHPKDQIIRDINSTIQTRRMIKFSKENAMVSYISKKRRTNHKDYQNCLFACFLSQIEPEKVIQALTDPSWIEAMQEELLQFKLQKVWTLVDLPKGKRAIRTKWVYRNKKDERGIVVREKIKAKIEAIRLNLAYASFMRFIVYQMDVKSAFLYGTIEEEVYVCQPPSFEDPQFPDKVYKVEKALYGLHQAPRAWYETLSTYLLENGFRRGTIDKTLFIKKDRDDAQEIPDEFYGGAHFLLRVTSTTEEALGPDILFAVVLELGSNVTPKIYIFMCEEIFRYLKEELALIGNPQLEVVTYVLAKRFDYIAMQSKSFSGKVTPLFESMLVQNQAPEGEGSVTGATYGLVVPLALEPIFEAIHKVGVTVWEGLSLTDDASLVAAQDSDNIIRTQTTAMPNVNIPQGMDIGSSTRQVESSDGINCNLDEVDASKQGRKCDKTKPMFLKFTLQEHLVSTAKPIFDPPVKIKRSDQGDLQLQADAELAQLLHQEELAQVERSSNRKKEKEQFTIEEMRSIFVKHSSTKKVLEAAQRAAEIRSKPPTKTQLRNMMITYLKNMGKFNHNQLKGKSYEELQRLYEREQKWINDFVPMDSEKEEKKLVSLRVKRERLKCNKECCRSALKQKSSKKQQMMQEQESAKSDEDATADYEHKKEELRMWLIVVPDEEEAVDPYIFSAKGWEKKISYAAGTNHQAKYNPGAKVPGMKHGSNDLKFVGSSSSRWSGLNRGREAFLADPDLPDSNLSASQHYNIAALSSR